MSDFRATLPQAKIIVYDNNSRDNAVQVCTGGVAAGAAVHAEPLQGKGHKALGVALILRVQWTVRLGNSTTFSGISTMRW